MKRQQREWKRLWQDDDHGNDTVHSYGQTHMVTFFVCKQLHNSTLLVCLRMVNQSDAMQWWGSAVMKFIYKNVKKGNIFRKCIRKSSIHHKLWFIMNYYSNKFTTSENSSKLELKKKHKWFFKWIPQIPFELISQPNFEKTFARKK